MARAIRMNSSRTISLVAVALVAFMAIGCSPWHFMMQRQSGWVIEGKKRVDKDLVDIVSDNQIAVTGPAGVSMRCYQITEGVFDTEITLQNRGTDPADGEVSIGLRSTPYADTVENSGEPAFGLVIRNNDVSVEYMDSTYTTHGIIPEPGTPFRIRVVEHGRFVDIEVACTNLGRYEFASPSTQWVSIFAGPEQEIELRDPSFRPLNEVFLTERETFAAPRSE